MSPTSPDHRSTSLAVNNIQTANLGSYTLVATNMAGSSTSNPGVLSFTPPPSFATHPASQGVAAGGTATFTATATSTLPITYQWQKDGTAIPGATTTTLTVTNVQSSSLGNYTCGRHEHSGLDHEQSRRAGLPKPAVLRCSAAD